MRGGPCPARHVCLLGPSLFARIPVCRPPRFPPQGWASGHNPSSQKPASAGHAGTSRPPLHPQPLRATPGQACSALLLQEPPSWAQCDRHSSRWLWGPWLGDPQQVPPQDSDGGSGSSQAESTLRGRLAMGTPGFGPLREGLLSPSSGALEGTGTGSGANTLSETLRCCQHSVERLDATGLQRAGVCRRARRLGHPGKTGEAELAGLRE